MRLTGCSRRISNKWYARNGSGEMVPFSAFATTEWTKGPPQLARFNGTAAIEVQGSAAPGVSSGAAMDKMEELVPGSTAATPRRGPGLSYQERLAGSQATLLYAVRSWSCSSASPRSTRAGRSRSR